MVAVVAQPRYVAMFPISPDGKRYVRGIFSSPDLQVVETETGRLERHLVGLQHGPYGMQFSPDGRTVAATSLHGEVCLWSAESGKLLLRAVDADAGENAIIPLTFCFSPDSRRIAVGNLRSTPKSRTEIEPAVVSLWDVARGKRRFESSLQFPGEIRQIRYFDGGKKLRVVSHSVCDLDARKGAIEGPKKVTLAQDLSDDGRFASAWLPGWIHVTDMRDGKVALHIPDPGGIPAQSVTFSPDNRTFALFRSRLVTQGDTGYNASTVEIWDLRAGKRLWASEEMPTVREMVCFSPDSQTILLANGEVRDVRSGRVEVLADSLKMRILGDGGRVLVAVP